MKRIEKKAWPELFEAVLSGRKTFDLRLADFDCQSGDTLVLREWDPASKNYTGRAVEKQVTYVLKTKDLDVWPKEDIDKHGYQVVSLK